LVRSTSWQYVGQSAEPPEVEPEVDVDVPVLDAPVVEPEAVVVPALVVPLLEVPEVVEVRELPEADVPLVPTVDAFVVEDVEICPDTAHAVKSRTALKPLVMRTRSMVLRHREDQGYQIEWSALPQIARTG
jgi:hypothetical protein